MSIWIPNHFLCRMPTRPSLIPMHFVLNRFLVLLCLALFVLPFDETISRYVYFRFRGRPTAIRPFLDRTETFGHGIGILWITVMVYVLDPARRKACLSIIATALCGGGVANIVKLLLSRSRPRTFDFGGNTVFAGFHEWLPYFTGGSGEQSFPSAHTATAVAVAVLLAEMYPRGRWLFSGLAMLVGIQRLHGGAHFPSDILVGAAMGFLVGHLCVRWAHRYHYLVPQSDAINHESDQRDSKRVYESGS